VTRCHECVSGPKGRAAHLRIGDLAQASRRLIITIVRGRHSMTRPINPYPSCSSVAVKSSAADQDSHEFCKSDHHQAQDGSNPRDFDLADISLTSAHSCTMWPSGPAIRVHFEINDDTKPASFTP